MSEISIIIPCFNEVNRIRDTLIQTYKYCEKHFERFEIIIVDDGSTDTTTGIAKYIINAMNYKDNVSIISYFPNRGKGYAVKTGVRKAFYELVIFMDADNATRISEIEKFMPYLDDYDLLIASRNLKESNIVIKQPLFRTLMGRTFAFLVRLIIGTKIKDTQCGFKVFCNKKAKDLFFTQTCERFAFDVELIMKAEKQGLMIKEIPVDWYNDERSKVNGIKDAVKMFRDVIKIWRLKNERK